jgi:regulatory protein
MKLFNKMKRITLLIMADSNTPSAMAFALKLLGLRNHSRRELEQKLLKKGYGAECIAEVVEKLASRGVLDDRAFGIELIRSRSNRKPAGKLKIGAELRKKGLSEAIVGELLKEYDSTALCCRAAEKKLRSLHEATDAGRKRKLEVFLSNRGFEWREIQAALNMVLQSSMDFEELC